jgi:hypothetical protein
MTNLQIAKPQRLQNTIQFCLKTVLNIVRKDNKLFKFVNLRICDLRNLVADRPPLSNILKRKCAQEAHLDNAVS